MKKILSLFTALSLFTLPSMATTAHSVREGFVVHDKDQRYLKIINEQGLVVDHVTSDNYEVYLMDHNCEQVNVMSDECIKLNKDNYLKIKSDE